jgi:hypothetical protein
MKWRELFEERAAICEYHGECGRVGAERIARDCVLGEWMTHLRFVSSHNLYSQS